MSKDLRSPPGHDGNSESAPRPRPALNAHVRLNGTIRLGPRFAMLEADNGDIWRLRSDEELAHHVGEHVIVEGRVAATDELQILWVGAQGTTAG